MRISYSLSYFIALITYFCIFTSYLLVYVRLVFEFMFLVVNSLSFGIYNVLWLVYLLGMVETIDEFTNTCLHVLI